MSACCGNLSPTCWYGQRRTLTSNNGSSKQLVDASGLHSTLGAAMDAAVAAVKAAIELDNGQNYQAAYDAYKRALTLLLPLVSGAFAVVGGRACACSST